jgi:hypothetical protein
MVKQIIFGIGTPRSGTSSLTSLFVKQPIFKYGNGIIEKLIYVKHEAHNINTPFFAKLELEDDRNVIVNNYLLMVRENAENHCYGSMINKKNTFYNHNLVNVKEPPLFHINISHMLLDYIDLFLKTDNSIKVVILKRNRENTINSIYNRYILNEKHYNRDNNSTNNFWFREYFNELNDENYQEIIGEYYDNYYNKVNELKVKYPDNFHEVKTETIFNSKEQQEKMFQFCGFKKYNICLGVHENKRDYKI